MLSAHSPHRVPLFSGDRLAHRPYCTDDYSGGLKIRSQAQALKASHIQANSPALRWRLVFDIDRPGALFAADDANVAPPSWAAVNPVNGHAHLGYELETPIIISEAGHSAPIRFAAAVERGYMLALKADRGYSGLMCKNPHSPRWWTYIHNPTPYDLPTLAEWLPGLPAVPAKGNTLDGPIGRNTAVFTALLKWAHRNSGQISNREHMLKACRYKAAELNMGGLPENELEHIARSVTKRVFDRVAKAESDERFSKRQAYRGKLGGEASGKARLAASEDKRVSARLMRGKGMTQAAIAAELGVHVNTVASWLRGLKEPTMKP